MSGRGVEDWERVSGMRIRVAEHDVAALFNGATNERAWVAVDAAAPAMFHELSFERGQSRGRPWIKLWRDQCDAVLVRRVTGSVGDLTVEVEAASQDRTLLRVVTFDANAHHAPGWRGNQHDGWEAVIHRSDLNDPVTMDREVRS